MRKELPFIILTATATNTTKKIIINNLCMKDCVEIVANPNRPSTRYSVTEVDVQDLYSSFSWLIDSLEKQNITTPKVIIFCRRKPHMKELFIDSLFFPFLLSYLQCINYKLCGWRAKETLTGFYKVSSPLDLRILNM